MSTSQSNRLACCRQGAHAVDSHTSFLGAGGEGDASLDGRIAALWKHLVALSEEKVQVAGQVRRR